MAKESIETEFQYIPPVRHYLNIYKGLDVKLTYQNSGSAWLIILRGKTEDIELAFNGLYNLSATNGKLVYEDHMQLVATFWSDEKAMRKFFFNLYFLPRCSTGNVEQDGAYAPSVEFSNQQMALLKADCHEVFRKFSSTFECETHTLSKVSAEKPDNDMKDAILQHAFRQPECVQCAD